ncbi:Radical SAM domain protein [Desulfitobacterium hafniense DCB-2]|uniref:Radical SAM domain protein n=1 Tax=Desulfitobacterium hafniense (strain DSM 10664 / DCB-2) TaxID=272564 RepID=B8FTU4_DESHD|nr:radical SAM protein [Desulfitobacterium hafniense]ACL22186.1 Radical SAM domain protein [Desulfitobacterium hafniense DCB-2]
MLDQFNKLMGKYLNILEDENYLSESVILVKELLKDKKIIIYGAGSLGATLYRVLKAHEINIGYFIDRGAEKITGVCGVNVYGLDKLSSLPANHVIIIAINSKSIINSAVIGIKQLNSNANIIKYGHEIAHILRYSKCLAKNKDKESFDIVDCLSCGAEERGCNIFHDYLRRISPACPVIPNASQAYSKSYLKLGYILGQYCTLKCKACCELVPYQENPHFVEKATVLNDIKKVVESCEFVALLEFIGGEPLLYPELEELLQEVLKIPNVGCIRLFTNGTVVPNEKICALLKHPRITLQVSNYTDTVSERLRTRIRSTMEQLKSHEIDYMYISSTNWVDFTPFDKRDAAIEELEKGFANCFISICSRLHNGILYKCPHQYAGVTAGKLSLGEEEHIKIHDFNAGELASKLDQFSSLSYINACRMCKINAGTANEIPAGEQI